MDTRTLEAESDTALESVVVRIDGVERFGTRKQSDTVEYIYYSEVPEVSEEAAGDRILMKISDNRLEITRRGAIRSSMVFVPGQQIAAEYITPYGPINLEVRTERLSVNRLADATRVRVQYLLLSGGDEAARKDIMIEIAKQGLQE